MTNAIAIAIETERKMKLDAMTLSLSKTTWSNSEISEIAHREMWIANITDEIDIEFEVIETEIARNFKLNFYHIGWSVLMLWATWLVTIIA